MRATIDVTQRGEEVRYSARGEITAAGLSIAEFLPVAHDLRATFELTEAGALTVRIEEGSVASGPLRGTLRIDSVDPLGTLRFDGELIDAVAGPLIAGFVGEGSAKITGPVGLRAAMRLDLSGETLDARALTGGLDLDARDVTLPGWDLESAIRQRIEKKLGDLSLVSSLLGEDGAGKPNPGGAEREAGEVLDSITADVDMDGLPWKLTRFRLAAGGLVASGSGTFDPLAGGVSVSFTARFDERKTAQLVDRYPPVDLLVDRRGRLSVPLTVGGTVSEPKIRVDLRKLSEEALADPEETVKGLLKGLLGRKKKKDRD